MEEYKIKTILQLKSNLSDEELHRYEKMINKAFDNRFGTIKRSDGTNRYEFIFEGTENENKTDRPVLETGTVDLYELFEEENLLGGVKQWKWIEDEPMECCDVIEVCSIPIRH